MKAAIPEVSHLLILPDGRLLARNVTPTLADALKVLQPENPEWARRAAPADPPPPAWPAVTFQP